MALLGVEKLVRQITPDLRGLDSDISWDWLRMSEAQLSVLTSRIILLDPGAWGTLVEDPAKAALVEYVAVAAGCALYIPEVIAA
jgi:hypothetical protein